MSDKSTFSLTLDPDLHDSFLAACAAADRPPSDIVRELMHGYIQRGEDAQGYDAFLARKVEIARASARAGRGRLGEDVETEFSRLRASVGRV